MKNVCLIIVYYNEFLQRRFFPYWMDLFLKTCSHIPKINELYKLKTDHKIIIEDAHKFFKFNEIGMTAILKENSANLGIRYLFKKLQEHSTREGKELCKWLNGKIINWSANEELMFFHFRRWKSFKIDFKLDDEIKGWFITEKELIPIFDENAEIL